jgi:hypothetical protein
MSGTILGVLLFCGSVLLASESDEFREQAKSLRKKASISAEQGNNEQAERLELKVEIQRLHAEVKELRQKFEQQ